MSYYYGSYGTVSLKAYALGLGVLLILAGLLFYLINPHQADVTVTDSYWTRTIAVEQYNQRQAESENVPAGATVISKRWVSDGYWMDLGETCYGAGDSEWCTSNEIWVDTSGWRYTYTWMQWDWHHDLVSTARSKTLVWPEWSGEHPNNQRLGNRKEVCTVVFTDKDNKQFTWTTNYNTWYYFNVKDKASIQVNHFGVVSEAHVTESHTPY